MRSRRTRWELPVIVVLFVWTLTTHGKFSVSGDEPHYLIVAESLLADRDLDLENNYQRNDGRRFGADGLQIERHARRTPAGALWSIHDIGLPVLILPIYAVATRLAVLAPEELLARFHQTRGLFAFSLISLSFTVMTALAASLLFAGLRRVASERAAFVVALVLALSPPVLSHAFLVFPDTPAFAVTCAVVWLVCLRQDELSVGRAAVVVASVGCLPWLHRKYSFYELGLLFVILGRHWPWIVRQRRATLAALTGLAVVPPAALHVWTYGVWGHLGGPTMLDSLPFSVGGLQTGGLGLVLDRERGLLGYAPIYAILPACWALGWRESRTLLVPILLLFLPMASFVVWSAGFSPAARYLVPLTPLLIVPAARALDWRAIRWIGSALLLFQAAITAYVWQYPRALWPKEVGTNQVLDRIPVIGPLYERWLPSLATGDSPVGGWMCIAALIAFTAATVAIARRTAAGPRQQ